MFVPANRRNLLLRLKPQKEVVAINFNPKINCLTSRECRDVSVPPLVMLSGLVYSLVVAVLSLPVMFRNPILADPLVFSFGQLSVFVVRYARSKPTWKYQSLPRIGSEVPSHIS